MAIYYIAGPMTIHKHNNYNRAAFNLAAAYLKERGHIALNPARHIEGLPTDYYMALAKTDIDYADAVYFLDGWEQSQGAQTEKAYAEQQGKMCFYHGFVGEV